MQKNKTYRLGDGQYETFVSSVDVLGVCIFFVVGIASCKGSFLSGSGVSFDCTACANPVFSAAWRRFLSF